MLDLGTNMNAQRCDGTRSIHYAASRGYLGVLQMLLAKGAEQTQLANCSPLREAGREGFTKAAKLLLDHVANVNAWWRAHIKQSLLPRVGRCIWLFSFSSKEQI